MGRKSSAKAQARPGAATPPSPPPQRLYSPWLVVAIAAAVIAGVFVYSRSSETPAPSSAEVPATAPGPAIVDPPRSAAFGSHSQENLPPLPFDSGPPARPTEIVRAVYKFT